MVVELQALVEAAADVDLVIKVSIGINCPKLLLVGGEGESYLYLAYFVEKLTGDSGLGAIIAWRGGQGDLAG